MFRCFDASRLPPYHLPAIADDESLVAGADSLTIEVVGSGAITLGGFGVMDGGGATSNFHGDEEEAALTAAAGDAVAAGGDILDGVHTHSSTAVGVVALETSSSVPSSWMVASLQVDCTMVTVEVAVVVNSTLVEVSIFRPLVY